MSDKEYEVLIDKLDRIIELNDFIDSDLSTANSSLENLIDILTNITYGVQHLRNIAIVFFLVLVWRYLWKLFWDVVGFKYA